MNGRPKARTIAIQNIALIDTGFVKSFHRSEMLLGEKYRTMMTEIIERELASQMTAFELIPAICSVEAQIKNYTKQTHGANIRELS